MLVAFLGGGFLAFTPPGVLGKADAIGYAVCHRIDLRSYHIGARQLPLCVRCTGMYMGAMLGLAYQFWKSRRCGGVPPLSVNVLLALFAAAFALDGLNSYLTFFPNFPHLYQPHNTLRLITGTGMGLVISVLLYPSFQQTIWREVSREPAIKNLREFAFLVLLAAVVVSLALTQNPLVLYPLALLSATGVLTILTLIYTMLWVIVLRRENLFMHWRELSTFVLAGFGFGLLQIVLIDLGRYLLTGTWDGFRIG